MRWAPEEESMSAPHLTIATFGVTCGDKIVMGEHGDERWVLDKEKFEWKIHRWSNASQCWVDTGGREKAR